jgi:single-strand DNA-binding protein
MFRVTFTGNLGSDPEERFTAKGDPMVNLSVAITTRRRDEGGEWSDHTDWLRVRCMGRLAEVAKRAQKGWRATVDGRPELRAYTARSGELVATADVWADELEVHAPAPRRDGQTVNGTIAEPQAVRSGGGTSGELEDIPF